jgi:hypothetical protein
VVLQGLFEFFPIFIFGDFLEAVLRSFSLKFGGEYIHEPFMIFFPFDSPSKSVSKGAQFWGFRCPRVSGVLDGNPSIPFDSMSFGGP